MLELIPEKYRTPRVARAVTSPGGILLAGAGAAVVIASGLPLILAPVAGCIGWAARVALALPRSKREEGIDPRSVHEPWRTFVRDSLNAKSRFDRMVTQCDPGPLRDRLTTLGERIGHGVDECWRIARHGDNLQQALHQLNGPQIREELAQVQVDRQVGNHDSPMLAQTEAAIAAQLESYERLEAVSNDALNRLRLLNARLDEAVARGIELSLHTGDASAVNPLKTDVDNLVGELENLRQGLEETASLQG